MQVFNAFTHPPSAYALAALVVSGTALCVSVLAFTVAVKNYLRKAGMLVRGTFTTRSSLECDSKFLSSLVIENLKDRAITVFAIYLRIGSHYYVEVEIFEKPLILRAFETYHKEYGPIEFYAVSDNRLNLNALFDNPKVKKRLVLSTGDGKYVVPDQLRRWEPVYQFFQNNLTAAVRTVRTTHTNGKEIGGNVRFVVDLVLESGKPETLFVNSDAYKHATFKNFQLTREALETKQALEEFLQQQVDLGKLVCRECVVLDMQAWREQHHRFYTSGPKFDAKLYSPFEYYVLGRVATMYRDWKLKRENAKLRGW